MRGAHTTTTMSNKFGFVRFRVERILILLLVLIGCWSPLRQLHTTTADALILPTTTSTFPVRRGVKLFSENGDKVGDTKHYNSPIIRKNDEDTRKPRNWAPGFADHVFKPLLSLGVACSLALSPAWASDSSSLVVGQKYWTIMSQGAFVFLERRAVISIDFV